MARPTKLTDETILKLCQAFEEDWCSIDDACALAGIHKDTYHEWIKQAEAGEPEFQEFSDLVKKARARSRTHALKTIRQASREASDGQWQAAAWFLERSDRNNWGKTAAVQFNGDVQKAYVAISPEDL